MFKNVSIMGRVIYIVYVIEKYLFAKNEIDRWKILLDALWSYTEYEHCIDNYAYKVIECTPETVLDESEDFTTYEFFSEDTLYELKELYQVSDCTSEVNYLMQQINDIMAYNLYTHREVPEEYSLNVLNVLYVHICELLGDKVPPIQPFEIYSINEQLCWGNYMLSRKHLVRLLNNVD